MKQLWNKGASPDYGYGTSLIPQIPKGIWAVWDLANVEYFCCTMAYIYSNYSEYRLVLMGLTTQNKFIVNYPLKILSDTENHLVFEMPMFGDSNA